MGSPKKRIQYRYDSVGNRSLMIDPDGGRTTYAYDALSRLTSLINPQGERTTYVYDATGRRTVEKLANGTRASFTYDAASRLTTLANLKSDNTVISKFDYQYDSVGNRKSVVEADGSRVTWLYDNTYQLIGEHRTGSTPYRNTFTYDSRGNRTLKNEGGTRTTYAYDAANQLQTAKTTGGTTTYTFDANGNQQIVQAPGGDRTTNTWDYENRTTLVQLPNGIRNTMAYEPGGLRVKLDESTGTKKFIWDQQAYLAETDANDDTAVVYTQEPVLYGNLISQRRGSATSWYHYEALGSTRQLTDATQAVTDQYLYDAWGNVIGSSGTMANPFRYVGQLGYYFDADTQHDYIRARTYDPSIGRWPCQDPAGFVDGYNRFLAYFVPNRIDPSGLATFVFDPDSIEGHPWDFADFDNNVHHTKGNVFGLCVPNFKIECICVRCPSQPDCKKVSCELSLSTWILIDVHFIEKYNNYGFRWIFVPAYTVDSVYGHEQRHVRSFQNFVKKLTDEITQKEDKFGCWDSLNCGFVALVYEDDATDAWNEFHEREADHANPDSPKDGEPYPPIGKRPPSTGNGLVIYPLHNFKKRRQR